MLCSEVPPGVDAKLSHVLPASAWSCTPKGYFKLSLQFSELGDPKPRNPEAQAFMEPENLIAHPNPPKRQNLLLPGEMKSLEDMELEFPLPEAAIEVSCLRIT